MKQLIIFTALLAPLFANAQELKEYKATNGVIYHVNDTVRVGRGSNTNGSFAYIDDRGFGLVKLPSGPPGRGGGGGRGLKKEFANIGMIIKSIRKERVNNLDKYIFMVSGAGPFRMTVVIDDAISACEVTPCKSTADVSKAAVPVASVADEIKKLKELLDSGAITKEEFESRKKKLLDQ